MYLQLGSYCDAKKYVTTKNKCKVITTKKIILLHFKFITINNKFFK